ncbi:MAG: ATP-dependent DNA helicase RecG [Bdellovibrionales bacterium GWC1_52_8]|nr:MAG: ATP-dependent DNA helicase RecG [Bdellovibrionales bacterium GWB1_52_6]OFZ05097.1 MAG: ATP-dependent DNA helicase RecG [Bdellovibrionales bacterium GWA1_52_35]OFZ40584.1 MAG: ATP-dependent DNA helicase RecG [Bdellovibrionales bacterium GWC1_52_8]
MQFVKGVGPRLGAIFQSRGIETVRDILFFFPRAYEDRTHLLTVSELKEGQKASIAVRVAGKRQIPTRSYGKTILEVRCEDSSGPLLLKWFHAPRGMEARFTTGAQLIATGLVKRYMGRSEIIHPEINWGVSIGSADGAATSAGQPHVGRMIPIYTEIEGIQSRTLRKIQWEAVEKFAETLTEDLPEVFLQKHGLPKLAESIRKIHFPPDNTVSTEDLVNFKTPFHQRLVYEEFFKFEYLILKQRLKMERENAQAFGQHGGLAVLRDSESKLPFQLTGGQKTALREILEDLAQPHPMNRLIQGDVGSGKTAVAFLAAGCVLAEGAQAALMAPTEILAEQHVKTARRLFGGRLNTALLTGKTPADERLELFRRLEGGEPLLLIGTHALLEDPVVFANLGLVMIDEQHRFGVEQRRTLRKKGSHLNPDGLSRLPHSLILTATPIPRTLALTAYGDLAVTSITELPPGRTPVQTRLVRENADRLRAYEHIGKELANGRQAYFIFPLVNESEAEGFTQLKSVIVEAERLGKEVFPEFTVGILHGQMKSDEKACVMARFQANEIQILVSTTVVEVGVDVPNSSIIAIEHAERFGLSQLHQLRGRVGRGQHLSYCYLLTSSRTGEVANQRLDILEETTDGFRISEADLEIRGPGEFIGTRQAGALPFRLANLVRDRDWLLKARDDASTLLKEDADLINKEHASLLRYFTREGQLHLERLKTS